MSQAKGGSAQLVYGKESSYKTLNESALWRILQFSNFNFQQKIGQISNNLITGSRNAQRPVFGNRDCSGSMATNLAVELAPLFEGLLGSNTTTGANPYTHTIKVGDLPSYIFELGFKDIVDYHTYHGVKITSCTITAKPDGYTDVSFNLMGAVESSRLQLAGAMTGTFVVGETITGGTSATTGKIFSIDTSAAKDALFIYNETGDFTAGETVTGATSGATGVVDSVIQGKTPIKSSPISTGHTSFSGFWIATIQEGGVDVANVTGFDVTIDNQVDGSTFVIGGGGIRYSANEATVKVSGKISTLFENRTLYNKAIQGKESSLKLVWKYGTGAGSAGNEYFEILIPELYFASNTPTVSGPQGIVYEGPFEAFYNNSAEASSIQMIIKNTIAVL